MKTRSNPTTGVREERRLQAAELREESSGELVFEGYAAVFNSPYEVFGGPEEGGWTEVVDPAAFNRTLKGKPDVPLNVDHAGTPLARTTSGTMKLSADDHGLKVRASLDPRSPRVQEIAVAMERRDLTEMSFAFWTVKQMFDEEESLRRLMEVNIDRGDVSIVTYGANPATTAEINAADLERVLVEVRSAGDMETLSQIDKTLRKLLNEAKPRTISIAEASRICNRL